MKKLSIYQMATCAIMAAVLCILGPMTIPIGPIPVSLATLIICISVMLLGMKFGTISLVIYLLLGLVGLPVLSGFSGGLSKLVGPTGGYIIGYLFLSLIGGFFVDHFRKKPLLIALGMILGTAVLYAFGTVWFVILMQCDVWYALTVCVFPFAAIDLGKIIVAILLGGTIYHALAKAGLTEK